MKIEITDDEGKVVISKRGDFRWEWEKISPTETRITIEDRPVRKPKKKARSRK